MTHILAGIFLVFFATYNVLLEIVSLLRYLPIDPEKYTVKDGTSVCGNLHARGLMAKEIYDREAYLSENSAPEAYLGYLIKVGPLLWLMEHTTRFDQITYNIVHKIWLNKLNHFTLEELMGIAQDLPAHKRSHNLGIAIMKLRAFAIKMYNKGYMFLMAPLTIIAVIGAQYIHSPVLHITMVILFLITAISLEKALGTIDTAKLEYKPQFYKNVLHATAILAIVLFWTFVLNVLNNQLDLVTTLAIGLNVAVVNSIVSYIVAHELGHSKDQFENLLADLLLINLLQAGFKQVHNLGHHKDVATKYDMVTAHRDETIYAYLSKMWKTTYVRAKEIDDSVFYQVVFYQVVLVAFALLLSFPLLAFFVLQFIVGLFFLETVNYIEHYGLMQSDSTISHTSWDCTNTLTNGFIFNIGHHANHHSSATVPYYRLRAISKYRVEEGYLELIVLAFQPKKWFKVMNAKIDQA